MKKILTLGLTVFSLLVLLALPSPLPRGIGEGDFRAYWSASYLLTRGENFADAQKLFEVERSQTNWRENYPMITWNPPWLLAMIAPYALVPFSRAVWWWMLTNIVLIFASAVFLWQVSARGEHLKQRMWMALLVAFAYSFTLTALVVGQVNLLVLVGVAGFLFFEACQRDELAGALLALTLVKPQLVYITVPILLLEVARQRRWRIWLGFSILLVATSAVVFVLRPSFIAEYLGALVGGQLGVYETPTLGGALDAFLGWNWTKWMGVVVLPAAILFWARSRGQFDTRTLVDTTLLASVITAPFAWSYDFVVLLAPLVQMIVWIASDTFAPAEKIAFAAILILANGVTYYLRVLTPGELYFFWVPILIAVLYVYTARRSWQAYCSGKDRSAMRYGFRL